MSTTTSGETGAKPGREIDTLLLLGRPAATEIRRRCVEEINVLQQRHKILPGLAVLRAGEDPASVSYADRIVQSFTSAGVPVSIETLPATATRGMLQAEIARLNVLPEIAGVIVQMPLPAHLNAEAVIDVLDPSKDVDGIHPDNIGKLALGLDCFVPATPAGGIALLDHYGIGIEGKHAVVVGRSGVVGRPLAQLLLARNATVTIAHSHTRDLPILLRDADILAVAVGKPCLVRADMVKRGAVVLDFGASMIDEVMTGDVDFEAVSPLVSAITPVPGGTGPVTSAMLLRNTIRAIKRCLS